jgi:hypothetical protein
MILLNITVYPSRVSKSESAGNRRQPPLHNLTLSKIIQRHLTAAAVLSKQASSFRMLSRRNYGGASTKAFRHENTESFPGLLAIN